MSMRALMLLVVLSLGAQAVSAGVTYEEAQDLKRAQLKKAAAHAVAQQRTGCLPPTPVEARYEGVGNVSAEPSADWDADGDGKCLKVTLRDIPQNHNHVGIKDRLAIRFAGPVNLLEKGTGLALWVKTPPGLSKDLRFGVYLKVQGTDEDPVVISDTPLVHTFGDNPHLAYIDWGYVFNHTVGVFKVPPKDFFTRVTGVELTFVQKRLPHTPVKLDPASGVFYLDGLQLVDWYDGSYDSDRFPKGGAINAKHPIVSQGRTQQVARIAAEFGGEAGATSALRAMDMMARIQCWDGSWPEMQTRLQGEFTHGMILADLAWALKALREQGRAELAETVTVRHWTMPRDALYEQMIYRGARSRSPAPLSTYRDTYCSGKGALTGGCNRPMYYIVSQYVAALVMTDPAKKREIMTEYDANMNDLVAHQGITAGGWPIFGEGNRYSDKGLHWDCSYTTDHVFIMAAGSRVTGDKRWGDMMKKFDTVVEAMVLPGGYQIDGALSERGRAKRGGLKAPDLVFQEAERWGATKMAQWAANASRRTWAQWPRGGSLWPYTGSARGYGLGAFLTWQVYDLQKDPAPEDLGHVFPRQWPVWTARWIDKESGKEVRRSKLIVKPGGQMVNTFKWEVGQYPVVTGLPIMVEVEQGGPLEIEAVEYSGSIRHASTKQLTVTAMGLNVAESKIVDQEDMVLSLAHTGPCDVTIETKGGEHDMTPVRPAPGGLAPRIVQNAAKLRFKAVPRNGNEEVHYKVRVLRRPVHYEHLFARE